MSKRLVGHSLFWVLSLLISLMTLRFLSLSIELASPMMVYHVELRPWVFYGHIGFSSVAMFLAPFQFWQRLRSKRPMIHRFMGRAYVASVLIGGISGLILAITTQTGAVAAFGFGALAVVWIAVSMRAVWLAKARRLDEHRAWMIRSAALTFAGVTLRLLLPIPFLTGLPFDIGYSAMSWLCWVPNLIVVEWWLRGANARPA